MESSPAPWNYDEAGMSFEDYCGFEPRMSEQEVFIALRWRSPHVPCTEAIWTSAR